MVDEAKVDGLVDRLVRGWSNLATYFEVASAGPHHRTSGFQVLVLVDYIHWDQGVGGGLTPNVKPSWLPPVRTLTNPPDIDLTKGAE